MNKPVVRLMLCALAGGVLLSACSKSKNAAPQPGAGANVTAAAAATDGPLDMKIKWAVGKDYPMHMDMDQTTTTDVPGQPQPMIQQVKLAQDFDFSGVKQLDNGGWQLELKFLSETMNVFLGDRNVMSFDSAQSPAQDANNPVAPLLRALIEARIEYFTDASGKVEKLSGVDELKSRVEATAKPQEQAMFSQMFSEATFKQYGSFADVVPDHPVTVGDSWPMSKEIPTPIGVLKLDMKYTFKNWAQHGDHRCAHVEAEGDISTKSTSTATGMLIEVKKGKISGDFWYDPALGMIVEAANDQTLPLKITTRSQTMASQFTQKVRVVLVNAR